MTTLPRLLDGAALLPYLSGEKDPVTLDPTLRAHVATLLDHQTLHAVTHPLATTFADLDPRSQAIYQALATALAHACPLSALYATGSRVKGAWRSGAPADPKTAIALRLGRSPESDVDVVALGVPPAIFCTTAASVGQHFGVKIDRQPPHARPLVAIPLVPIPLKRQST